MLPSRSVYTGYLCVVLCEIIAVVKASPYFMADHPDPGKPWRYPKKCDKKCPYGFNSDVEGGKMCQCHDPCSSVMCLGGLQCVVEKPKLCLKDSCKYFAACKDINICDLPQDSVTDTHCDRKTTRWFFDKETGKCTRYRGCRGRGNNFGRKRDCKKKCYKKYRRGYKGRRNRKQNNRKTHNNGAAVKGKTLEWVFPKCPENRPFVYCAINPCSSCKDRAVVCIPNYCGVCSASYLDLKTGRWLSHC